MARDARCFTAAALSGPVPSRPSEGPAQAVTSLAVAQTGPAPRARRRRTHSTTSITPAALKTPGDSAITTTDMADEKPRPLPHWGPTQRDRPTRSVPWTSGPQRVRPSPCIHTGALRATGCVAYAPTSSPRRCSTQVALRAEVGALACEAAHSPTASRSRATGVTGSAGGRKRRLSLGTPKSATSSAKRVLSLSGE